MIPNNSENVGRKEHYTTLLVGKSLPNINCCGKDQCSLKKNKHSISCINIPLANCWVCIKRGKSLNVKELW